VTACIFPGCLVAYRFPEYEKSASLVLDALGVKQIFVDCFTCCGSQVAESADEMFLSALGARNLAIAQAHGVDTVICLCGSCTYELLRAKERMENPLNLARVNEMLAPEGLFYDSRKPPKVKHVLEVFDSLPRKLKELCRRKIGVRAAVQEPCNAFRPAHLHPALGGRTSLLRDITTWSGAECVPFDYENRCCGGTMLAFDEPVGMDLASLRYRALETCDARIVVTACPNCHSVYYVYPRAVDKKYGRADSRLPSAIFITQLLGLSMGMTFSEVGLDRHIDRKHLVKVLKSEGY
jgi:heterodisulfide reductase subunit B